MQNNTITPQTIVEFQIARNCYLNDRQHVRSAAHLKQLRATYFGIFQQIVKRGQ